MDTEYLIALVAAGVGFLYGAYCGYKKPIIIPVPKDMEHWGNAEEARRNADPSSRELIHGMIQQGSYGALIFGGIALILVP